MTSTSLSNRLGSRRRSDPGLRWVRIVMAVLSTIGAIDTGTITLKRWGVLGNLSCPGGAEGCDKVLSSAWGSLFGQPLSLFGFLAYTTVLLLALLPLLLRGESRQPLGERSWWGLFLISTSMAVFSLLLMGLMVFKIQSFCPFCVLSAVLSVALMVLSIIGGDWPDRSQLIFRGVLVVLLVTVVGLGWISVVDRPVEPTGRGVAPAVVADSSPEAIALADHLTATGASIYTAYWCPHCHEQKELFGRQATARLKVIECAPDGRNSQAALCEAKKLEAYPSWEINGKMISGVKPLSQLAQWSGFKGKVRP